MPTWLNSYLHSSFDYGGNYFNSWGFGVPVVLTSIAIVMFGCMVGVTWGERNCPSRWSREKWSKCLRRAEIGLVLLWALPVTLLMVGPFLVLVVLFFFGRAWFDLIPDKETRIDRRERKVADLRGRIAETR